MEFLLSRSIRRSDAGFGCPHSVPPPVEVPSICISLLFHDEAVVLRTKRIDLEYVGTTAIVVGIDQDFEVVVQVLAYVPPEFGRDDPRGLGVITMNSEIHGVSCVENPYFRPLGWQLAFVGFPLTELHNGFGGLPEQVVQGSVELWGVINRSCFRINPSGLALCG